MAPTKYTYNIEEDFPNSVVDETRLSREILASSINKDLSFISTTESYCYIWFSGPLSTGDEELLDSLVAGHTGEPIVAPEDKFDGEGRLRVVPEPEKDKQMKIVVSHNWCDKCTWYSDSSAVVGEELVDTTGSGLVFSSQHQYWIDLTHGRFYREDLISGNYGITIKDSGVEKNERAPYASAGGDYVVDYEEGTVEFFTPCSGTVTADYNYANGSTFVVSPSAGTIMWLLASEVQFSEDVNILDTTHFQGWAYNPYDLPNKVPVTSKTTYKNVRDYIDEARGCYPEVPAIGGPSRGLQVKHYVFPFNYVSLKELRSSYGAEIRVWLEDDIEFGGTFATATFYCVYYDEE
jgi:hypothetical protein